MSVTTRQFNIYGCPLEHFKMLKRNLLLYYQGPGFAAEYNILAKNDYEAVCSRLWAIVDELMAAGRAFLYSTATDLSLSQLISGTLSVSQLIALARKFAARLEQLIFK
jgi:hypothetical protein